MLVENGFDQSLDDLADAVIGIDRFGESAPADQLFELFGFTVANVVKTAKALLS